MNGHYALGDVIFGEWKLVRLIGEGSFGQVYEAHREDFGRTYKAAIKIITIPQSQSEIRSAQADGMDDESVTAYFHSFVEEMVDEFDFMSKLKGHTNIVSYEDHRVLRHENDIGWDLIIRMELLTPLLEHVREGAMTRQAVIRLGIDMCRALELCQKYNIIHRDIKPENIFISDSGDYKLGDFGVARTAEKTTSGLSKKGTYTYMAPEVYKEQPYGSSVDLYSLGLVLYWLLNESRTPFLPPYPQPITYTDRSTALTRRIAGELIPSPKNATGRLSEIVLTACAYDPKDRYSSPVQMRQDLEAILYTDQESPVIYPEGDALPARTVNNIPTSAEEEQDKTCSIFSSSGQDAPIPAERTESIFSSKPVVPEQDKTESIFGKRSATDGYAHRTAGMGNPSPKRQGKLHKERGIWSFVAAGAAVVLLLAVLLLLRQPKEPDEAETVPPPSQTDTSADTVKIGVFQLGKETNPNVSQMYLALQYAMERKPEIQIGDEFRKVELVAGPNTDGSFTDVADAVETFAAEAVDGVIDISEDQELSWQLADAMSQYDCPIFSTTYIPADAWKSGGTVVTDRWFSVESAPYASAISDADYALYELFDLAPKKAVCVFDAGCDRRLTETFSSWYGDENVFQLPYLSSDQIYEDLKKHTDAGLIYADFIDKNHLDNLIEAYCRLDMTCTVINARNTDSVWGEIYLRNLQNEYTGNKFDSVFQAWMNRKLGRKANDAVTVASRQVYDAYQLLLVLLTDKTDFWWYRTDRSVEVDCYEGVSGSFCFGADGNAIYTQSYYYDERSNEEFCYALSSSGLLFNNQISNGEDYYFASPVMAIPSSVTTVTPGYLTVVTDAKHPPFSYLNNNGEPVGFELDMMRLIAGDLHLALDIVRCESDELFNYLQQGQADVAAAAIVPTAEMKDRYAFSDTYYVIGDNQPLSVAVSKQQEKLLDYINISISDLYEDGPIITLMSQYGLK